jgi:hypothetical protein
MKKGRDYIKLASISFIALLIFAAVVLVVLVLLIKRLHPPFSTTLPSAVTPSLGPYSGGLTKTVNNTQLAHSSRSCHAKSLQLNAKRDGLLNTMS